MAFCYKKTLIEFTDDNIKATVDKYFELVWSQNIFSTLEKLGFQYPIKFSNLKEYDDENPIVLCTSADDKLRQNVYLDLVGFNGPTVTLVDLEECRQTTYDFSGKPMCHLIKSKDSSRKVEFKHFYNTTDGHTIQICLKETGMDLNLSSFTELSILISGINVKNDNIDFVPNILTQDDFCEIDNQYSSIDEYILNLKDLESADSLIRIYNKIKLYYLASHFTLQVSDKRKGSKPFVTSKLDVVHNQIFEYANSNKIETEQSNVANNISEYAYLNQIEAYNGQQETYHLFFNGDCSLEKRNSSIKFFQNDGQYSISGKGTDEDFKYLLEQIHQIQSRPMPTL